jgi:hypothetical protein
VSFWTKTHSRPLLTQVEHTGLEPSHFVFSDLQLQQDTGTRLRRRLGTGLPSLTMAELMSVGFSGEKKAFTLWWGDVGRFL